MTLPVPVSTVARLSFAALEGLDVVYVVVVYYGGSVGTRYYSTRPLPLMTGINWEQKLLAVPSCPKRSDASAVRFDALNDDLEIRLRNTPEREDGQYDTTVNFTSGGRIQDLMTEAPLVGAKVDVGMADVRGLDSLSKIKWDGRYRVDRVDRNNKEAVLYCVDRMLHPGEKMIGSTVNDQDWPKAPDESYGQVRGPVFGMVDGLPLVPVEVGLFASLASEIDDQDGVVELSVGDMSQWPANGYVEIGDEVVYYPVIDRTNKRLGSTASKCTRGTGFPKTTPAAHVAFSVVKEVYTGRTAGLNAALTASSTSIVLNATPYQLPSSGVVVINQEAIRYASKSGNTLSGLTRGVPVPTIAKVHNIGSSVRTIPVGPDGNPRYRYLVAEGEVSGVGNLRVQDENGNDLPYAGGAAISGQVTAASGKVWSVVDLPARPRFERYESSGSQVPSEWIFQTDGRVDSEGVATNLAFLRWTQATGMSQEHVLTWPRAVDPSASTRAVILEAVLGKNIFAIQFDAKWDNSLQDPRYLYGRFKNARLRLRVQYDRQTTTMATYQIHSNQELVKSGVFQPPTVGGGSGDGSIQGQQKLPESRWGTQPQTKEVRLSSRTTDQYADGVTGYWIDPVKVYFNNNGVLAGGGNADHSSATDGDTRSFVSGAWSFPLGGGSVGFPFEGTETGPGANLGTLSLFSNDAFPEPSSTDRLKTLVVTLHNPSNFEDAWTGWDGFVNLFSTAEHEGNARSFAIGISKNQVKRVIRLDLSQLVSSDGSRGLRWADCQSLKVDAKQYITNLNRRGATVGNISLAIEYVPDVEGQRIGTLVEGSYFKTTATTTPSAVYDQPVSLGQVAKDWAQRNGRDPWDFFSNSINGEGMRVTVQLPTAGDGLKLAMADVVLEMEYEALSVIYDGLMIADVNGRTGPPATGGADILLQNPIDILAHLVDEPEFMNMAGDRDTSTWTEVRALLELVGWRLARAIVEPVQLRELIASLCAESRMLLLADGLKLYTRFRFGEATAAEAVRTVGDQIDPALALVSDQIAIANRLEDIHNSIGCYYRRNYITGAFKTVMEEEDAESIRLYQKRRATPNLEWHQSALGYAGGLDDQKARLRWLTTYQIDMASRLWDYATIEVPASAAEDLQRYDVIIVNRPRSGYYSAPGRVVSIQRVENPMRYSVMLQMNRSTLGYIWQSTENPLTYIKLAEAAARMDFVVQGTLQAQLTSSGHFRCRGNFTVSGTSIIDTVKNGGGGTAIHLYREIGAGVNDGKFERLLTISDVGDVTLYAYHNGTSAVSRGIKAPGSILDMGGVAGIVDTVAPTQTGRLEFYLANKVVLVIDSNGWTQLGKLRANLGLNMGSE